MTGSLPSRCHRRSSSGNRDRPTKTPSARKLTVGDVVEVRSVDDGFLGSWHIATVVSCGPCRRQVKYLDVLEEDGRGHLVETVAVSPILDGLPADNIGVRDYRGLIRPLPPDPPQLCTSYPSGGPWEFSYSLCVDVRYMDAWWEGVIFDVHEGSPGRKVFFPDLGDEMLVSIGDMRVTQDWEEDTGLWQVRGDWLFLHVIEDYEEEWPLVVSVKQMWYDVREKEAFRGMEWTSTNRSLWRMLLLESVKENLEVAAVGIIPLLQLPPRGFSAGMRAAPIESPEMASSRDVSLACNEDRVDAQPEDGFLAEGKSKENMKPHASSTDAFSSSYSKETSLGSLTAVKDVSCTSVLDSQAPPKNSENLDISGSHDNSSDDSWRPANLPLSVGYHPEAIKVFLQKKSKSSDKGSNNSISSSRCGVVGEMALSSVAEMEVGCKTWESRHFRRVTSQIVSSTGNQNPRTVLSWLMDSNILLPRAKVCYSRDISHGFMAEGQVNREGIKCSCCNILFTLSGFAYHADRRHGRTSSCIFLEDGRSLLDCQIQMLRNKRMFGFSSKSHGKMKGKGIRGRSDDICSICHYGGQLILCDSCPCAFHEGCLGLEEVPDGDWFCPSCRCCICGQRKIREEHGNILTCDQCRQKFHMQCLNNKGSTKMKQHQKKSWCCSQKCAEISFGLSALSGKPVEVEQGNMAWTLLQPFEVDIDDVGTPKTDDTIEMNCKLNVAVDVIHECFEPVKEFQTRDLIEDVVFSRGSPLGRLNFRGFYTVLLERNDELISVACVRGGNVIGAVVESPDGAECFQGRKYKDYLNFSHPMINSNFEHDQCVWLDGMNLLDLVAWRRNNLTGSYLQWLKVNTNTGFTLWNPGTHSPALIAFADHVQPIDPSWHLAGLGHRYLEHHGELLETAAVIHFSGPAKPWLEIGSPQVRSLWYRHINTSNPFVTKCRIME